MSMLIDLLDEMTMHGDYDEEAGDVANEGKHYRFAWTHDLRDALITNAISTGLSDGEELRQEFLSPFMANVRQVVLIVNNYGQKFLKVFNTLEDAQQLMHEASIYECPFCHEHVWWESDEEKDHGDGVCNK